MKGTISMISTCFEAKAEVLFWPQECWHSPALWTFLLVVTFVALLTVGWLKIVYTRYETTTALPIEYGTVHFFAVLGGMFFFRELEYMSTEQVAFSFGGLAVLLVGVAVSACSRLPRTTRKASAAGTTASSAEKEDERTVQSV